MRGNIVSLIALAAGVILSALLGWFAVGNYRSAQPIAEGNLRGLALSLTSAMESVAARDPSLASLAAFRARDIAYIAIIDRKGTITFHSNADLIGARVTDQRFVAVLGGRGLTENRIRLGTGEEVYEYHAPLHLPGRTLALRLALHPWRADAVIHRARIGMTVLFSLLAAAWIMGVLLYRHARRAQEHRLEMARRERLAQLGEMGAVLAHEVRNPLSGIKGYAQLLMEQSGDGESQEFATLIVTEAMRLESLVSDLLTYARPEPDPDGPLQINAVIDHVLALVRPEAQAAGVAITASLAPGLAVRGHEARLEQLLLNLIKNGIQAMPEGGELAVISRREGKTAEISVADQGNGIPPHDRERIFTPFFTTKARGSGLGLPVCRKIAEAHGGTISVVDNAGGAVFRVTLPLHR
jgi:two-component system sensor histidine kinase HydH